jgi:hypothetical protein
VLDPKGGAVRRPVSLKQRGQKGKIGVRRRRGTGRWGEYIPGRAVM